jgi:hypothetical protein
MRAARTAPKRELRPYANEPGRDHNEPVSMYAELLSSALGGVQDLHGAELMGYVLDRRAEMLAVTGPVHGPTAFSVLAVEVAYDCALLTLCAENGIAGMGADFSHPADDRRRLEVELKLAGIDVAALARRRKDQA